MPPRTAPAWRPMPPRTAPAWRPIPPRTVLAGYPTPTTARPGRSRPLTPAACATGSPGTHRFAAWPRPRPRVSCVPSSWSRPSWSAGDQDEQEVVLGPADHEGLDQLLGTQLTRGRGLGQAANRCVPGDPVAQAAGVKGRERPGLAVVGVGYPAS